MKNTFSPEYILSLLIALSSYYYINIYSPNSFVWLKIFTGLFFGYLSLLIFNSLFPTMNSTGYTIYRQLSDNVRSSINYLDYLYVFPPLLVVLIIFMVLLYSGQLGK
jgi:hypothetical protein|tara:strand:+ start:510 stop:830 length:321 start_codon:yes stop_codon:yes gene_type:complete